jgi:hypothetical protein
MQTAGLVKRRPLCGTAKTPFAYGERELVLQGLAGESWNLKVITHKWCLQ